MSESYNRGGGVPGLVDVTDATMRALLGTRCLSSPGLAIGTTSAAAVKIANTTTYIINGVFYSKTTAEIAFTNTTVLADGGTAYYLVCLNAAGSGLIVNGSAITGDLPSVPAGYCPIGYVKVVTSGADFTPGTTELSAATVTDTYVNISVLPTTLS